MRSNDFEPRRGETLDLTWVFESLVVSCTENLFNDPVQAFMALIPCKTVFKGLPYPLVACKNALERFQR
jgi:hypothetical protein